MKWHATPFEERLEKALSEETVISQRYAFLFKHCFLLELYSLVKEKGDKEKVSVSSFCFFFSQISYSL